MEIINSIFSKAGLSKDEWFLNINDFEKGNLINKSKDNSIYEIKEKNSNNSYAAKVFNKKMNTTNEYEKAKIPQILQFQPNLKHKSFLQIKGISPVDFNHKNMPVLIMEYAPNGNLSNFLENGLKKYSNLTYTEKLINIYGIASAMKYLHSQGIVHRQLETSSIILDEFKYPKLFKNKNIKKVSELNQSNQIKIFVNPSFVAPETWEHKLYTKKSDVYSFSMIVYEIITNRKPQQKHKMINKIIKDVVTKKYRPTISSNVPQCYQDLIKSCWSDDPDKRPTFSDIVDLLKTNEEFLINRADRNKYDQYIQILDPHNNEPQNSSSKQQPSSPTNKSEHQPSSLINKSEQQPSSPTNKSEQQENGSNHYVDYIETYSSNIQKSDSTIYENGSSNLQKSLSSMHETDSSSSSKMLSFQSDSQISKQLPSNANLELVKQSYIDIINNLIDSKIIVDLDNFAIFRQIGEGSFAKTFLIRNKKTEDIYAAKINRKEVDFHSDSIIILREAKIMSKIDHPSIIKFIGFSPFNFSHKKKPTIIMEYASNGTLSDILKMEERGLSPPEWEYTKRLINIYGIASGMKYLHSQDIIHRDLKPSNILEDQYLFPKITDFGLSKNINSNNTDNIISSNQELKGTPLYMAPEIFKNQQYSKKSDVYSFAYIVYEIFSGHNYSKNFGQNVISIFTKITQGIRPEIDSTVPTFYQDLISKCWSEDPSQRPSFSEIVEMLKNDTSFDDLIDIDEYLKYIDFIDFYFESSSQDKAPNTLQGNEKKFKIDYSPLLKSKMIIVSVSIPKIDLENYNKKELIGSGSYAKVYHIENKETGEIYAAKILKKKDQFLSDTEKLCVLREINILSKIKYESIIKFFGYSSYNFKKIGRFVFVTEIAKNGSLGTVLKLERKGLAIDSWNDTKKLINIYGIACGMKHLHENSIIHRDLKPDNILLDEYLYPKITDFGLSKLIYDEQISHHQVLVIGTPAYVSPEIWKCENHSYESDVYAFALIVYEIVTGEKIIKNINNVYDLMNEVKKNHYRPKFNFPIPDYYKNLIKSCWSEEKSSRPTFKEIVEHIKTNSEFIENIDFNEFQLYTELVGEPYPIQNKTKPEKNIKKISIPHTEKEISELTISAFNKIIENDHQFSNCFLNLNRFEEKKVIKKSDFYKIVKVVEKETKKTYAARISSIDMNQFTENEMREISNEMLKISKIRHPCILKFVGFSPKSFKNESKPVVITKYEKMNLLKKILIDERKKGFILGWDSTSKLKFIFGLASAMNCLHSNGIIHRNLTPSSIFITKSFNPLLYEFGLCSHLLIMESITFQSTNQIKTLPIYSAPEILSSKESTKASDVYSFGLIVYEILAFENPFSNVLNIYQLIDEVVVKNKRPNLPVAIADCYKDLIKSCWNQNPNERPKFIDIVNVLKNDNKFITSEVNKESYLAYINQFDYL